jgi:type III secretory pathway component EscS
MFWPSYRKEAVLMGDVGTAFKIILLASTLGLITCAFIGVVILIVRRLTSGRKEGVEQT